MEQVTYGTQTRYEVVDKTLLYDKLNVEKGYGQVVGTGETSLKGGSTTAEDRIQIDDKLFYLGKSNAKVYVPSTDGIRFLGYNVLYYARIDKTTDEKTLICIRQQSNKNKSVTIVADDIVGVTGDTGKERTIEYWANTKDKSTKTEQIAADAVYIYNGKYKTDVTNEQLKPKSGNIVLLDADTNGIYETIFVNHLTNIVVDTVSTITGRVTDKYLNGSLVLDKDNKDIMFTLTKNGEEIDVSSLKEWNVISYTISEDKKLIKAYVSDASINGVVNEVTEDGYRIGSGTELYKKAPSYPNDIKLRDRGTFYLDITGEIAAVDENAKVETDTTAAKKYGYLVGAIMNEGFATTGQFKIFTGAGETSILTSTEKMRYNSDYGKKAEEVVGTLNGSGSVSPQLIMYETNSTGEITAIDTANVGIGTETVIFEIPSDAGTDTTKYSIRSSSSLSNDTSYSVRIYDLQDNYMANAVVITNSTGTTSAESPILLVDHISETQNKNEEITDRLYGWESGAEKNLLAVDKTILKKSGGTGSTPLQKGDIIQYRVNTAGEIDGITVLFDSSAKATEFNKDITNDLTCVYGRVTKKFSGSVNVEVGGDIRNYATGDAVVYLYDSTRNNKNIEVVSASDIEIYEEGNEARLFLRIYQDQVKEMVIVK